MGIVTDYPFWFILLCLLAGGIYAFALYFRANKSELPTSIIWIMAVFRFLSVTILSFLLLSPLIRKNSEIAEKPVILFVQDNSISIASGKDSAFYNKEYPSRVKALIANLEKKYEVVGYSFGDRLNDGLKTSFTDKSTDISSVFEDFRSRYANRNIGALILATDGIYNKGSNPFYSAANLSYPIYTIALGDTLVLRDLIVNKVLYNRTAFMGDKFLVEVQIRADQCNGENSEVTIESEGETIDRKPLHLAGDRVFQKTTFFLDAREKGIRHYTVRVKPVDREVNTRNNQAEIFIEIRDTREKIALLYQTPHPDVTAIRQSLESFSKYDLTVKKIGEFTDNPSGFNLIILYQVPSVAEINNLSKLMESGTSLLFVLGSQSDLGTFNGLNAGLQITSSKELFSESVPAFNPDFSLFTTSKDLLGSLTWMPPLNCPFGTYRYSPVSEVLFHQKIGNVVSSSPLILFTRNPGKKTGIIAGENLWKWRLTDFQQRGNHDAFNDWIGKIVQYLSVKDDRSLFRVKTTDRVEENESVTFDAELYNESFEMINDPDVKLEIRDENGKSYPYLFGKNEKAYYLNAGVFPVGKYTYSAAVNVGKTIHRREGSFIIDQLNLENLNLVADHNLLYRIAKEHGGEMVYPGTMENLSEKILAREDIRPLIYWKKQFTDLAGNPWIFSIIIALLTAEWFLRKRYGIY